MVVFYTLIIILNINYMTQNKIPISRSDKIKIKPNPSRSGSIHTRSQTIFYVDPVLKRPNYPRLRRLYRIDNPLN